MIGFERRIVKVHVSEKIWLKSKFLSAKGWNFLSYRMQLSFFEQREKTRRALWQIADLRSSCSFLLGLFHALLKKGVVKQRRLIVLSCLLSLVSHIDLKKHEKVKRKKGNRQKATIVKLLLEMV